MPTPRKYCTMAANTCWDAMQDPVDEAPRERGLGLQPSLRALQQTFAQCVQRMDGHSGMKPGMKPSRAPVYTKACERAEAAVVQYFRALVTVARRLYAGTAARDKG